MKYTALQFVENGKKQNFFVGVFRYIKSSGVKSTKDGELYGFLEIGSDGELPAERVAHMAWDGVVEGYMYSQTKSISESLKSGVQEFTRRLKDLMRNSSELEEAGIDVSLVIISATKEGIYLASIGENEIYAYKDNKIIDIIEILESNKAQTAGFPTSGKDLVVVSTNSLLSENMHTLVGKKSKEEVIKSLNLLGKTLPPGQGILCIYPETVEKEKELLGEKPKVKIKRIKKEETVKDTKGKEKKIDSLGNIALFKDRVFEKTKQVKVKALFSKIKSVFVRIVTLLKKIFTKVSTFLKKVSSKIGNFLREKLGNKRWYKKYAAKASEIKFKKKKSPGMRIDGYKTKNLRAKRIKIAVLATLAVVLAVGGYQYARKQKEIREMETRAEGIFNDVNSMLQSAKSSLSTDSKEAEREIFAAGNLLKELPEGLNEEYIEQKNDLEQEVLGIEDDLYKRVVVDPDPFTQFNRENTELTDIEYVLDDSGNELLIVTDKGDSTVWKVNIFNKKKEALPDNNGLVESPKFLDIGNNGDIFVYDESVGVLRAVSLGGAWSAFEKITGAGLNNIDIDEVGEFAVLTGDDNLYYLDTANSRIVKSVNYGTGYSSTVVTAINDDNFSKANDFFADFSVYVLTEGKEGVLRYSAGAYVPISIVGVNGEIGELLCGDTVGNMDFGFYMFDNGSKRVLRMEKPKDSYNDKLHPNELVLLNQYVYRGDDRDMWSDVKDIVVDRDEKNMYLLDGNNVWRVSL